MTTSLRCALLAGAALIALAPRGAPAQTPPWAHVLFGLPGEFAATTEARYYDMFGDLGESGQAFSTDDDDDDLDVDTDGGSFRTGTGFKTFAGQDFGIFLSGTFASGSDSVAGFGLYQGPFFDEGFNITGIDADFDLRLYALDTEYGQAFALAPNAAMRVFGGLRAAWLDLDRDYFGPGFSFGDLESRVENEFWGVGPRAGTEVAIDLGGGFSLSSVVAASLLAGRKSSSLDYAGLQTAGGDEDEDDFALVPVAESEIGVTFARVLTPRTAVYVTAGYRAEYWFDIVNDAELDSDLPDQNDDRDLGFNGPFIRGTITW